MYVGSLFLSIAGFHLQENVITICQAFSLNFVMKIIVGLNVYNILKKIA